MNNDINHLSIVDQLGREVYKYAQSSNKRAENIILSLGALAPGPYFLRVFINGSLKTIRINKT